ncbi:MAG TPA: ethanolamine ammonia-lyase reactivating factor EutA [Bacillales bacterium]|nr:ethanolamine ammonia-lyase reactivating factor EutA [Bacillales bacterium]
MKLNGPQKEEMISAGIDIGTSTTKMIISKFTLKDMAGGTHVPRIEIINKQVLYRSPIYRTPLLSSTDIDIKKVELLIRDEYRKAGIEPKDIKTGAVIITGETATKSNAAEMVHYLSNIAGEFLVATAGPDLEGIIAAKGSGAYEYSKESGKVVANIDIGGGTANTAVFKAGKLCGTCTLHIGGRLIEFSGNKIGSISEPIKNLLKYWGLLTRENDSFVYKELKAVTNFMADVVGRMLNRALSSEDQILLLGHEPNWLEEIDAIMFSGGISECIYQSDYQSANSAPFHDIGKLLAESLKTNETLSKWLWIIPQETVRATVLGAGMETTEISGATIEVDKKSVPIKNLPVYQIPINNNLINEINSLPISIREAIELYDPQREGQNFALYLSDIPYLRFHDIDLLANSILLAMKQKPDYHQPLVIVLDRDYAKVLGQTIKCKNPLQAIICIDQINVENGDYLDIGQVLATNVVPVIIKTLTFSK